MADPVTDPVARCQWCSAELPSANVDHCPACGAALAGASASEPQLPGITTLDTEAIRRAKADVPRPRNRILSFLTGEVPVEVDPAVHSESLAPPPADVRREMLRLELDAERTRLEADQAALRADAISQAIDKGQITVPPGGGLEMAGPVGDAAPTALKDEPPAG